VLLALNAAIAVAGCLVSFEDYPVRDLDGGSAASGGISGGSGVGGAAGGSGGAGVGGVAGIAGAAGVAGDAGSLPCSTGLVPISDDFADGNLNDDPKWIKVNNGVSPVEFGGYLELAWPGIVTQAVQGGIFSSDRFTIKDCGVHARVVQVASNLTTAYTRLALEIDPENYLELRVTGAYLISGTNVSGTKSDFTATTYIPAVHAWWRLAEYQGLFHFQTSGDGIGYTDLGNPITPPLALTGMRVVIAGGSPGPESTAPGVAKFDQLNLPPQ
jgi:hypothetical protein